MKKLISISVSPNAQRDDVACALRLFINPFVFRQQYPKKLEDWFRDYFKASYVFSFVSGRFGLYAILKALNLRENDEVILQAFTCVAVPNAVIAAGARPIYVDINNEFTLDEREFEKKITKNTKAVIVQHTFGIPSKMEQIMRIAKRHRLYVIEDCAHVIGGFYQGSSLGTFGDASFFSFGRDKALSAVFGSIVIANNKKIGGQLSKFYKKLKKPNYFWTMQQLFHPLAFFFLMPIYDFGSLGKLLIVLFQKLHMLSLPVSAKEKKGSYTLSEKGKMPDQLACLALNQLRKIEQYNDLRKKIVEVYSSVLEKTWKDSGNPLLRYPLLIERRERVLKSLREKRIYLGKWYSNVIDPLGVDYQAVYYKKGSCPNAEKTATKIINLPTYPKMTLEDAKTIGNLLKEYV